MTTLSLEDKKRFISDLTNSKDIDEYLSKSDCIHIGNMIKRATTINDTVNTDSTEVNDRLLINPNIITYQKDGCRVNLDLINDENLINMIYNYIKYKMDKNAK